MITLPSFGAPNLIERLTQLGLPLGPLDQEVTLHARHRGRRLHASTRCPRYEAMSPKRWPFDVRVSLAQLRPEHLCPSCASWLSTRAKDPFECKEYLNTLTRFLGARELLARPEAPEFPRATRLKDSNVSRLYYQGLAWDEELRRKYYQDSSAWKPLGALIAQLRDELRAALETARAPFATPRGQAALLAAFAIEERQSDRSRRYRARPSVPGNYALSEVLTNAASQHQYALERGATAAEAAQLARCHALLALDPANPKASYLARTQDEAGLDALRQELLSALSAHVTEVEASLDVADELVVAVTGPLTKVSLGQLLPPAQLWYAATTPVCSHQNRHVILVPRSVAKFLRSQFGVSLNWLSISPSELDVSAARLMLTLTEPREYRFDDSYRLAAHATC